MSHLDISLRTRIFLVVMLVIVAAQVFNARRSVERFQTGYLKALEEQCRRLGAFLERDLEHVLGLGVPLTRLGRLEQTLGAVLAASPELAVIAVCDEAVPAVTQALMNSARSGRLGDGKIFVTPLHEAMRIRSRETGTAALT